MIHLMKSSYHSCFQCRDVLFLDRSHLGLLSSSEHSLLCWCRSHSPRSQTHFSNSEQGHPELPSGWVLHSTGKYIFFFQNVIGKGSFRSKVVCEISYGGRGCWNHQHFFTLSTLDDAKMQRHFLRWSLKYIHFFN